MASPAENAATLLSSLATGTWQIKIGVLVDSPDTMIAFFDTGGSNPNTKWRLDFRHIQVLIRGLPDGYSAAWAKGEEVKNLLLGRDPVTHGDGSRWSGVTGIGDLGFLKRDEKSRPIFSVNYRIILEPNTGTYRESL